MRNKVFICLAALFINSVLLLAHAGMEHVMGTVAAISGTSITVDTIQQKSVTVLLDASTKFTHGDAQASIKDLKVGDRVVIHAKPTADKTLVGVIVKWGANSAGQMNGRK